MLSNSLTIALEKAAYASRAQESVRRGSELSGSSASSDLSVVSGSAASATSSVTIPGMDPSVLEALSISAPMRGRVVPLGSPFNPVGKKKKKRGGKKKKKLVYDFSDKTLFELITLASENFNNPKLVSAAMAEAELRYHPDYSTQPVLAAKMKAGHKFVVVSQVDWEKFHKLLAEQKKMIQYLERSALNKQLDLSEKVEEIVQGYMAQLNDLSLENATLRRLLKSLENELSAERAVFNALAAESAVLNKPVQERDEAEAKSEMVLEARDQYAQTDLFESISSDKVCESSAVQTKFEVMSVDEHLRVSADFQRQIDDLNLQLTNLSGLTKDNLALTAQNIALKSKMIEKDRELEPYKNWVDSTTQRVEQLEEQVEKYKLDLDILSGDKTSLLEKNRILAVHYQAAKNEVAALLEEIRNLSDTKNKNAEQLTEAVHTINEYLGLLRDKKDLISGQFKLISEQRKIIDRLKPKPSSTAFEQLLSGQLEKYTLSLNSDSDSTPQ